MNFGHAIEALINGQRVQREGWNGKGLTIVLELPSPNNKMTLPFIYLEYPKGNTYPDGARVPWQPSQTDTLADDWVIVMKGGNIKVDSIEISTANPESLRQQVRKLTEERDKFREIATSLAKYAHHTESCNESMFPGCQCGLQTIFSQLKG